MASVMPFPLHQLMDGHKANEVVRDVDALAALAAALVRGLYVDRIYQFMQVYGVGSSRLTYFFVAQ